MGDTIFSDRSFLCSAEELLPPTAAMPPKDLACLAEEMLERM
jgi:hypothetical protein